MEKQNAKILDVCCGGKMFYFDKNDPRVLFQDIREVETTLCDGRHFEIKPDVVGDFRSMQFADESFSLVVFDPPHLKYTSAKETKGWQMTKYGWLDNDWKNTLMKGFSECFRVLKRGGVLGIQVERNRYTSKQDLRTNTSKTHPWTYIWQTC